MGSARFNPNDWDPWYIKLLGEDVARDIYEKLGVTVFLRVLDALNKAREEGEEEGYNDGVDECDW